VRTVFWIAVGAGVTIFVISKAKQLRQQATPQALGQRAADRAQGAGDAVRDFTARLRAAMAERETELRDTLGLPEA
jgi:hypothetical protein